MARWGLRQSEVVGSRKPQGGVGHTAIDRGAGPFGLQAIRRLI